MPLSKSPRSYGDVKAVLDLALEHGGGRYETESPNAAVRWRLRAYYFRSLLGKQETPIPGYVPSTPYDEMFLTLDQEVVVIEFRKAKGTFTAPDGTKRAITTERLEEEAENEWSEAAAELAKELEGK